MFFRKGEPITGYFDGSNGFSDKIVKILHKESQVPYFAELV